MPYGVLCFLPSYSFLNKVLNRWNENGMASEMQKYKTIFSETRVAKDFNDLLSDYYRAIDDSSDGRHCACFAILICLDFFFPKKTNTTARCCWPCIVAEQVKAWISVTIMRVLS
jgi:hypothetical protein